MALSLAAFATAGGIATGIASGEVGIGPPVAVRLPMNTPLATTLHTAVYTDDPSTSISATIDAYLKVGSTSLGRFARVNVNATGDPADVVFRVSPSLVQKARATARRHGLSRASVVFVQAEAEHLTGHEAFVSLAPAVRTSQPTRMSAKTLAVGRERTTGWVSIATPRGWPRTSTAGAAYATFGQVRVTGLCVANVVAQPKLVAARTAAGALSAEEAGTVVSSGRAGGVRWSVATSSVERPPAIRGVGARQVAPRRFIVMRIHAQLTPGCGGSALRSRSLAAQVQQAVAGLRTNMQIRR